MSRQCFSTRRLRAIFSCSLVQTGDVSWSLARSCFTCTRACHSADSTARVLCVIFLAQGEEGSERFPLFFVVNEHSAVHIYLKVLLITAPLSRWNRPDHTSMPGNGIGAYRDDPGASAHGPDVEHQHLVLAQLRHLALLLSTLQGIDLPDQLPWRLQWRRP